VIKIDLENIYVFISGSLNLQSSLAASMMVGSAESGILTVAM
jgi:hypothetical protein